MTTHAEGGFPDTVDAVLLLAGAAVAFGGVGALAFGGITRFLAPASTSTVRVWGGMHLPSVGLSILVVSLAAHVLHGHGLWCVVGFVATATYLVVLGAQFWFATQRGAPVSGVDGA